MKRKVFDLRPWARTVRHTQTVLTVPGHVIVDYLAHEVVRPLDVTFGEHTIRVLDSGFRWVRIHPTGSGEGVLGSALTAQLGASGAPVQVYVDIHAGEGLGEDGLPWTDDVYLDVLGDWQGGEVRETHVIDGEELEDAVRAGQVTPELAEAAWALARQIEAELRAGTYAPLDTLRRYLSDPYT